MGRTVVRWSFEEWERLYAKAKQYFMPPENPENLVESLHKAQQIFPPNRRRPDASFINTKISIRRAFEGFLEKRRAIEKAQEEWDGLKIRWTTREKALLAREVNRIKSEESAGETGMIMREYQYLLAAQRRVLPASRQRSIGSLRQAECKGRLAEIFHTGAANVWTLPPEQPPEPPAPEIKPQEEPQEQPQEPLQDENGTQAPPVSLPGPERLQAAMSELLRAHADYILDDQLRPLLTSLLDGVQIRILAQLDEVRAEIARGLQTQVHSILEAELGPLSGDAARPQAPPATEAPRRSKIPLDVVGLLPGQAQIVRRDVPEGQDVRFLNSDEVLQYKPRSTAIVATKFISHKVEDHYKSANAEIVRVNGGPHSVISALRTIDERRRPDQ